MIIYNSTTIFTFFRVIPQKRKDRHNVGTDTFFPVKTSISDTSSSKYQSTLSATSAFNAYIDLVC